MISIVMYRDRTMSVRSQVEPRHIKKALELVRGRIKNVTKGT